MAARRARASASVTGRAEGGGSGAASSHSGRRRQTFRALAVGGGVGAVERGEDVGRPAPAGGAHAGGERGGVAVQRGGAALRQAMQQGGGEVGQQRGLGFQAGGGIVVVERQGQAARGGGGGAGGQDEGEEFQQVESRAGAQAEAAEGGRGVHEQGRGKVAKVLGGVGGGQEEELAVRGEDGGTAVSGDHGRGVRQRDARAHGAWVIGWTKEGQGSAPGPRQGALPPEPPAKAQP